jgi:hypothetical protein
MQVGDASCSCQDFAKDMLNAGRDAVIPKSDSFCDAVLDAIKGKIGGTACAKAKAVEGLRGKFCDQIIDTVR